MQLERLKDGQHSANTKNEKLSQQVRELKSANSKLSTSNYTTTNRDSLSSLPPAPKTHHNDRSENILIELKARNEELERAGRESRSSVHTLKTLKEELRLQGINLAAAERDVISLRNKVALAEGKNEALHNDKYVSMLCCMF